MTWLSPARKTRRRLLTGVSHIPIVAVDMERLRKYAKAVREHRAAMKTTPPVRRLG